MTVNLADIKVGDLFTANGENWIDEVIYEKLVVIEISNLPSSRGSILYRMMWLTGPRMCEVSWYDGISIQNMLIRVE